MTINNYRDYKLSLEEKENKMMRLHIEKPLYLSHEGLEYGVETVYAIVHHVFEHLPASTCKTIEFGFYKFDAMVASLISTKKFQKKLHFKFPIY